MVFFLQNSSMNTIAANNINNSKYQYRIGNRDLSQ